jgi:hypothetical protein
MHQNTLWKEVMGVAVLIFFAALGVAHVLYPNRFLKPWHRGGEMLTERNRSQIQIVGAILAGCAIYVLYSIVRG